MVFLKFVLVFSMVLVRFSIFTNAKNRGPGGAKNPGIDNLNIFRGAYPKYVLILFTQQLGLQQTLCKLIYIRFDIGTSKFCF